MTVTMSVTMTAMTLVRRRMTVMTLVTRRRMTVTMVTTATDAVRS